MSDDALQKAMDNATGADGTPLKWRQSPNGEVEVLNPATESWVTARFKSGNDFVEWDPKTMTFKISIGATYTREYLEQVASKGAVHADANVALKTQELASQVAIKEIEGKTQRTAIVTFGVVVATIALAALGSGRNEGNDA